MEKIIADINHHGGYEYEAHVFGKIIETTHGYMPFYRQRGFP
ncbi:unnamed protein product, partial [marine sediment metagenome]